MEGQFLAFNLTEEEAERSGHCLLLGDAQAQLVMAENLLMYYEIEIFSYDARKTASPTEKKAAP